jgi:[acyl-carrier-protein] S-malonyltransferase
MNKSALIFEGQGSNFNGFGRDFYEQNQDFRKHIDEYKSQFDINGLVYNQETNDIDTALYQPACFLIEVGIANLLISKTAKPFSYAGSSLGEFSALCLDGCYDVANGLEILKKRASLMKEELSKIQSGMSAIMFLDNDTANEIAIKNNCEVSNNNSYGQVVISGLVTDLDKAEKECVESGAKRTIRLETDGAFHSKYLINASREFASFLEEMDIKNSQNVYFNYTSKKELINTKELIAKQMCSKVRFREMIENMLNDGIEEFLVIGPSGTMTNHIINIAKTKDKKIKIKKITTYKEFEGVICEEL